MKLYYTPGACSLATHIVLREAGLPADIEKVNLANKTTQGGDDYLAVNPKGSVPALQLDDGDVLTEVAVVMQYVAEKAGAESLAPKAGSKERYRMNEWLNYVATEVHKGFGPLFKPNTPDAYKAIVKENLARQFAYLDKRLADRSYLAGSTFTLPDAYLFTVLNWTKFHKIDLSPYTNVTAFMERVAARPKVQEAMKAEGLLPA